MGSEFNLVSRDAQRALEEFSQEFSAALAQGAVEQWAKTHGLAKTSRALKTTYPVPVSAAGYAEFKGDMKYRGLFEKSIELKPKTWQDGIAELASIIEAPDFTGWNEQPAAMAAAGEALPNEIIAGLLEANGLCWDGQNFFDSDHPVNVFDADAGTFDNDFTGAGTDVVPAALKNAMARTASRSVSA
jgi:phage major head subunit gpT-like protein